MNTKTFVIRIALADGECAQAVEAIDSHREHILSDSGVGCSPDTNALLAVRAQLCTGTTCEMSHAEAAALRTALEARRDELEGDIADEASESWWLAGATRCLADVRMALMALRSALGEEGNAVAR